MLPGTCFSPPLSDAITSTVFSAMPCVASAHVRFAITCGRGGWMSVVRTPSTRARPGPVMGYLNTSSSMMFRAQ